jgi:hypothetical protein
MGLGAGYSSTTANSNTFIGSGVSGSFSAAGYFNTTGTQNTYIGGGGNMTTGSKNTILGLYSGNQGGLDIRTATGYVVLSDGDGRPLLSTVTTASVALEGATPTTGTGITFPATQNASSNANTLDDYEEGTWSPTVVGSTSAGVATYTIRTGRYVKIGKLIFISVRLGWSAHTGTGNLQISNLPFVSAQDNYYALTVAFNDGLTIPAGSILNMQIANSSSLIGFNSLATGGTTSPLAMDTSVSDMGFSGCYETST